MLNSLTIEIEICIRHILIHKQSNTDWTFPFSMFSELHQATKLLFYLKKNTVSMKLLFQNLFISSYFEICVHTYLEKKRKKGKKANSCKMLHEHHYKEIPSSKLMFSFKNRYLACISTGFFRILKLQGK